MKSDNPARPIIFGGIVGVPPPVPENLKKLRDEVIAANKDIWFRPKYRQVLLGRKNGKDHYEMRPVLDAKGAQVTECLLLKVTADLLGADI